MTQRHPTYAATLDNYDPESGLFALSFVTHPANRRAAVALSEQKKRVQLSRDKQILSGVLLIPGQQIYRNDAYLGEYYMFFSAQEIEKIALKLMMQRTAMHSTTHQHELELKGNYLIELWTVADSKCDKSVALGLGELPVGTLCASYKITDPVYWSEQIKSGKVTGFSIEGFFNFNKINMSKIVKPAAQAAKKPKTFLQKLAAFATLMEDDSVAEAEDIVAVAEADEVDAGKPVIIFGLADGSELYVWPDFTATFIDGTAVPPGQHELDGGDFITIDDDNKYVETAPEAEAPEEAIAEAVLAAARQKGKAIQAKMKKTDPKAAQIAALKAQIAKLEKAPSAAPAVPAFTAASTAAKNIANLSQTDRIAASLRAAKERKSK